MSRNRVARRCFVTAAMLCAFVTVAAAQPAQHLWTATPEIFPGVRFAQAHVTDPRALDIFAMRIDCRNPRIRFHATGRAAEWKENESETIREGTRDFVRRSRAEGMGMVAAINADVFKPWPAPFDQRSPADLRGLAVSEGVLVSPAAEGPSFVVYDDGRAAIEAAVRDLSHVRTAVSGYAIVLAQGKPLNDRTDLQPRTGIGVSEDSRFVILLVIDGRRHASIGATTEEVGRWLLHFGAYTGMNLDGGGSSTIVRYDTSAPGDGVVLLNHPVGDGKVWLKGDEAVEKEKYIPTERTNGNNLGVYLAPK